MKDKAKRKRKHEARMARKNEKGAINVVHDWNVPSSHEPEMLVASINDIRKFVDNVENDPAFSHVPEHVRMSLKHSLRWYELAEEVIKGANDPRRTGETYEAWEERTGIQLPEYMKVTTTITPNSVCTEYSSNVRSDVEPLVVGKLS